jgi:hypothetical protein
MYIYPSEEKIAMEGEEDVPENSGNSEMRYIALELMKLAQKSGRSFDEVAREYIENAARLAEMIAGETPAKLPRRKGEQSRQQR